MQIVQPTHLPLSPGKDIADVVSQYQAEVSSANEKIRLLTDEKASVIAMYEQTMASLNADLVERQKRNQVLESEMLALKVCLNFLLPVPFLFGISPQSQIS